MTRTEPRTGPSSGPVPEPRTEGTPERFPWTRLRSRPRLRPPAGRSRVAGPPGRDPRRGQRRRRRAGHSGRRAALRRCRRFPVPAGAHEVPPWRRRSSRGSSSPSAWVWSGTGRRAGPAPGGRTVTRSWGCGWSARTGAGCTRSTPRCGRWCACCSCRGCSGCWSAGATGRCRTSSCARGRSTMSSARGVRPGAHRVVPLGPDAGGQRAGGSPPDAAGPARGRSRTAAPSRGPSARGR